VDRAQPWELRVPDLEEAHRLGQVLEAMLAEVVELAVVQEPAGRLRDDDLAAVSRGADACGAVDVDAHVPLLGRDGIARVHAHPHQHGAAGERRLRFRGRGDRLAGGRECVEEGVALCVHLDAVVRGERIPQDAPVVREQRRVALAVLLQQPRRPLDVGEEECDGAGRQPAHRGQVSRVRR
jgi:hypothetical protein